MKEDTKRRINAAKFSTLSLLIQIELGTRKGALESAVNGDWVPLGDYFKDGGRLTPEIRAFIVDAMYGRCPQPRRKSSPARKEKRDREIARRALALRTSGERRAVEKVAEEFGLEPRQAWRAFKKHRDGIVRVEKAINKYEQALENIRRCVEAEYGASPRGWPPGRYPARLTPEHFYAPDDIKS